MANTPTQQKPYGPASTGRRAGRKMEDTARRWLQRQGNFRLAALEDVPGSGLSPELAQTAIFLLSNSDTLPLAKNTETEGLWVTPESDLLWVEVTGSHLQSKLPGLLRTDNVRKIAFSLEMVVNFCHHKKVMPPKPLAVTSNLPKASTASEGYLQGGALGLPDFRVEVLDRKANSTASVSGDHLRHELDRKTVNPPVLAPSGVSA